MHVNCVNMRVTKYKLTCKPTGKLQDAAFVKCSKDAYNIAKNFYKDDILIYESFYVIEINQANGVIGYMLISQGGVTATCVDPILIAKFVIDTLARAVVLIHNHPSGNLKPSTADINLTRKTKEALNSLDVTVVDHLILSETDYYSFANEGLL